MLKMDKAQFVACKTFLGLDTIHNEMSSIVHNLQRCSYPNSMIVCAHETFSSSSGTKQYKR